MVAVDERRADADVDVPVDEPGGADEADHHVELARGGDVERVDRSIPTTSTSSSAKRELKATVARIAIFAAASAPETSSVGSASAKPRACASRSASS